MADYTDIYQIVNTVNKQITGQGAVAAVDATTFIAVGNQILVGSTDNIYRAIAGTWAKTIWAARAYTSGVMRSVEVDEERWGAVMRKVSFLPLDFEKSNNWNTDIDSTQLDDGNSINPFVIRKAKPVSFYFQGNKTLQSHITHFRDELESALESESAFNDWYYAKMVEYFNDIETKDETERRLIVLNFMAGANEMNSSVLDLTTAYNSEHHTTYTRDQLLTTYVDDFMKFAAEKIQVASKAMKDRTALYHANVTGKTLLRHTPKEFQKALMFTTFVTKAKAHVMSSVFNPEYLDIGTYEEVNFWQNPLSPAEINIKPKILNTTTGAAVDGTAQNIPYVVGLIYDERALTISNKRRSSGNIFNPGGDYTNDYLHWLKRYNNDFTENHLLIIMSNGGNSKTASNASIPEESFDPKDDVMDPNDPAAMEEITTGETTGKKKK